MIGTSTVAQIGILVHDIEKTAKVYSEFLGVEPKFVTTDAYNQAETNYLGSPSEARAKLAFFSVGPSLDIELIEPDEHPSTWRHDLDKNGEGIHHIAFFIKGMDEKVMVLNQKNMPLLQRGKYTGGEYSYIDATDDLKIVLELLENH